MRVTQRLFGSLAVAFGVLLGWPVMAHHSFAAEFDASQPITLTGTVTRIDWTNPHVWFYINVKDEAGAVTRWGLEMGAPHQLQTRGWLRETMKIGDQVTVQGSLARDGTKRANARTVITSDGRKLGAASSESNTPQP
jgi:hypothetical protein